MAFVEYNLLQALILDLLHLITVSFHIFHSKTNVTYHLGNDGVYP